MKKSSGVTQIYVWSDPMCFATIWAYLRSGDPSKPIEKVLRAGLPSLFNYFCNKAATKEESIPPLSKAAIGLSAISLLRTA